VRPRVVETEDEVKFVVVSVNMLARYHEAVARIARVSAAGADQRGDGVGRHRAPVSRGPHISWTDALGRIVPMQEFQAPAKILFLSSQASRPARKNLTARGWTINEKYT